MPTTFQALVTAIIADERARVKAQLDSHPSLARDSVAEEDHYAPGIAHYVYAGDVALHVAAAGYRVEIARMLLAAGAEVAPTGNRRGSQPLHYAADGHPDSPAWNPRSQVVMIRLLLQAGAKVNAPDKNGATPLHRAVRNRCAAAVKCLLEAGADPTLRNQPGSTPFHLAVQNTGRGGSGSEASRTAQREILQTFLDRGVSPDLTDAKGKSVREWARSDWIRALLAGRHD